MATNTYVALDKVTTSGSVSSVTLNMGSSISQAYTDLRLVINGTVTVNGYAMTLGVNGDTGSNFSQTLMSGSGSAAQSARYSNATYSSMYLGGWVNGYDTTAPSTITVDLMNYSNTTTRKTMVWRSSSGLKNVEAGVILWRGSTGSSSEAINSITIYAQAGSNIASGATFSLYGIKAWQPEATPKATGGYVTSDSTYWYHTFPFTSTFTPLQSLSCDYLVVAGGGGGGLDFGGGGGAGGLLTSVGGSQMSVTATPYTITVGAGGVGALAVNTAPTNGGDSTFSTATATGGGRGGSQYATFTPTSGGSGGGGAINQGGAVGTSGQGNSGGGGANPSTDMYYTGGGGGAGGAGANGSVSGVDAYGGAGGVGVASSLSGTSTYYAGGGGGMGGSEKGGAAYVGAGGLGGGGNGGANNLNGSPNVKAQNGTVSTGGGGGGASNRAAAIPGGNGGSGIVIIRYAK